MSSDTPVPALPEGYVVPAVWTEPNDGLGGTMGKMNRPVAGARFDKPLPRGEHPLQLYSLGTPNGHKVTILLEELGIEYDAWKINIMQLDQFGSEFTKMNPNSKIPALLDYSENPPLRVFESGSILMYIAEKYGRFFPKELRPRTECLNWLMWQMGTAPFIGGGFGHFYKYAPIKIEYAIDRYSMETKRQLDLLDKHLAENKYICGEEYTIADMAIFPWIRAIPVFYGATEFLQFPSYKHLNVSFGFVLNRRGGDCGDKLLAYTHAVMQAWMERVGERPAVKRGLKVSIRM